MPIRSVDETKTESSQFTLPDGKNQQIMTSTSYLAADRENEQRSLSSSTVSKVFFCWVFPYLRSGRQNNLELDNIQQVTNENAAETIAERINTIWSEEQKKPKPKLRSCLIANFLPYLAFIAFLSIMKDCVFRVSQGLALGALINAFSTTKQCEYGIYAGVWLIVALFLYNIFHHYFVFLSLELGMKIRVALSMLIYDKALRLSQCSLGETSLSQIVNLLTNDANRFDLSMQALPYFIVAPLQIMSASGVLWMYMGPSCLGMLILLVILVPFQSWVGKMSGKLRVAASRKTDDRTGIINEAINGIQIIKMCAFENVYFKKILAARKAELKVITKTWIFDALNKSVADVASNFMITFVLLIYVVVANSVVNAATVFVALTLTNYVRITITNFLPMAITALFELRVSINRIETFLLLEEKGSVSLPEHGPNSTDEPNIISMTDFTARWTKDSQAVISNATINIQPGKLTAVMGSVASGKTSLINGILGELFTESGTVNVTGSVSYAPQDAWIFSGTIQDNILAGEKLDQTRYLEVVDACSLTRDIDMFPDGSQTSVGEKGAGLSGGQKARVNLARAVYRKADIYLLDDPLSAVDVKVGKHIYEHCICGILKSKTVVLVTSQLNLLRTNESVEVVMLKEGTVAATGSFAEIKHHLYWEAESGFDVDQLDEETKPSKIADPVAVAAATKEPDSNNSGKSDGREKTRTHGAISMNLHKEYFTAGNGWPMFLFYLLSVLAAQMFIFGSDIWLRVWTRAESTHTANMQNETLTTYNTTVNTYNTTYNTESNNKNYTEILSITSDYRDHYFYIGIYAAIVTGSFVTSLLRNFALVFWTMSSSSQLHNNLFMSIVRAPMNFFQKNSMGRVMNLIVNDIGSIDTNLPRVFSSVANILFQTIGILSLVCYLQPLMLVPALLFIVLLHFLRNFYLSPASDIKRIESIARSPVLAHVGTTIAGLTVIRALKSQYFHRQQFVQKQGLHSSAYYLNMGSQRWFALVTDLLATGYVSVLVISFWLVSIDDGSSLGLAICNALYLAIAFSYGVSQLTMLDNQLIAVERVLECSGTPSEGDLLTPDTKTVVWGDKGKIDISSVTIAYDGNSVLRNVSLQINPGERLGIVGRSGAGKSTLINGFYRLVNLASGQIQIDGVDISTVGLHNLRRRLTIMPQQPQLFTGTVRYNLDPLEVNTDDELYTALRHVKLLKRLNSNLCTEIAQGGSNFSTGERQLLCLARAILSRTKILILDEATASLDSETDSVIQSVISDVFGNSTVITIAHRLDTIIKCDRVLVLDAGVRVEFDEPHLLLQNKSGCFYDLVNQSTGGGPEYLTHLAEEAYLERHKSE